MARGGARNRSGPGIDPGSARSDSRGISLTSLPVEGRVGRAPSWPLRVPKDADPEVSLVYARARRIWSDRWKLPQAVAWEREAWRVPIVAQACLLTAQIELYPGKSAALVGQLHRYHDQLGLTPAGLKENGWRIGGDERSEPAPVKRQSSSRDRVLKAVSQ